MEPTCFLRHRETASMHGWILSLLKTRGLYRFFSLYKLKSPSPLGLLRDKSISTVQHISHCYEDKRGPALVFSLCFTWHGAGKGTDRFYAWPDALSHLKGRVLYLSFSFYILFGYYCICEI